MSVIKKLTAAVAAVAMAAVAASCSGDPEPQYFFAMDTYIELKCDSERGMAAARQVIENAGGIYDRYLDSSAVSKLNRGRTTEDKALAKAVKTSLELYKKTDGYFDISLGQVISAWDIGGVQDSCVSRVFSATTPCTSPHFQKILSRKSAAARVS